MKKLLLILCIGCSLNPSFAQDQNSQQSVQDSHHTILGYIKGGTITAPNHSFLGDFKPVNGEFAISDKNHKVIGYLQQGKVVQDANHKTLGYINSDGKGTYTCTIQDANNRTLGYINEGKGTIEDSHHVVTGYEINTEVTWVAPYFFFFKF